jgi:hypothetical protein
MQVKSTDRTLRDLFHRLQDDGQIEAAAGVYLAARALWLPGKTWHPTAPTLRAVYALKHREEIAS